MAIFDFVRHSSRKRGWGAGLTGIVVLCAIFFPARVSAGQQATPHKHSAPPVSKAPTAFAEGLNLNPKSTGIRNDMGNLYVAQGNLEQAEKEFREVVRLNPAN